MVFQIGIAIAISISKEDRDRDRHRDRDFGDLGHALIFYTKCLRHKKLLHGTSISDDMIWAICF